VEAIRSATMTSAGAFSNSPVANTCERPRLYSVEPSQILRISSSGPTRTAGSRYWSGILGGSCWGRTFAGGVADLDGQGDTVGGHCDHAVRRKCAQVIDRVKTRLAEVERSLPPGVKIVTTYDRSDLIERSIETLKSTAHRGTGDCEPGYSHFPVAHPERHHPHFDHPIA